ncbi:uncharacterized protein LOC122048413 [Zingiber officinale]|uniref:uncharacterized protein LOC122048413 n=1 Tax=Zingiber officinale TaxID=94328 RepID=UPI001C4B8B17|nr:uncharacterized protein LOC122048413 [Zingiber officinale]
MKNEIKQLNQIMKNSEKHQNMQDSQIAQIARSFSRAPGAFLGKPNINPVEHCNRIELRSGWTLGDPQMDAQKGIDSEEELSPLMPTLVQNKDREEITKKVKGTLPLPPQSQTIPFPQKLITSQKVEEFHRFLKKIKEICIEVPLIDAQHQMLKFAKFLKGILSNRRQKGDFETVALTEKCMALLTADTLPKLQDLGSFSIPCKIGSELIHKAFYDLGASIPMGIVEYVPVEIGGCIVPTDFVVLDMEEDPKIPIILGRPLLATAGALIDENASKSNVHKAEECSFHGRPPDMMHDSAKLERSPPTSNKKCICPA